MSSGPPLNRSLAKADRELRRPESLAEAVKRERNDLYMDTDCYSCRIMGATTFAGLGVYSYVSGHRQLRLHEAKILQSGSRIGMPARRLGVTLTSAILVGLGAYRVFM